MTLTSTQLNNNLFQTKTLLHDTMHSGVCLHSSVSNIFIVEVWPHILSENLVTTEDKILIYSS